jgi:hypothetical protein
MPSRQAKKYLIISSLGVLAPWRFLVNLLQKKTVRLEFDHVNGSGDSSNPVRGCNDVPWGERGSYTIKPSHTVWCMVFHHPGIANDSRRSCAFQSATQIVFDERANSSCISVACLLHGSVLRCEEFAVVPRRVCFCFVFDSDY